MSTHSDRLSVLSSADVASFIERGYVLVREAFERSTAERLLPHVWSRLPESPNDPSTWTRPAAQIEAVIHDGPVEELFTPRYCGSIDDLLGAGRWWTRRDGFGWPIILFPGFWFGAWVPPPAGWHVDGMNFQHHLNSKEQGLVGIEILTDIKRHGGGTAVRVGSHRRIARLLRDAEPGGISYAELLAIAEGCHDLPAEEVIGNAGDVIWMHPFMVHARSPHTRDTARVISNRCVSLHAPFELDRRTTAEYSPVEQSIRLALER